MPASARTRTLFHLAVTWFVWGTAYLAIAASQRGLPPLALASLRFIAAGAAMVLVARAWEGRLRLRALEIGGAAWIGFLLITIGDGAIIWAVQHVPSGQVAVLVGTTPLFAVFFEALERGRGPGPRAVTAALIGLAGTAIVAVAADGGFTLRLSARRLEGIVATLLGSAVWAWAAIAARRVALPRSTMAAMGLQLAFGGVFLALPASALGEWGRLDLARLWGTPGLAVLYLIVACCMLAFGSYMWLVRHVRPALATSFAYVNPVVAVWVGHLAYGEPLGAAIGAGTALVVVAVVLLRDGPRG